MSGYYGGYMGNEAGMIAGSPGYFLPDKEIQDRLFNYGMQNTPRGQQIQRNIEKLQQTLPAHLFRRAEGIPGAPGNFAGMMPPPGFQNKIVS